MGLQSTDGGGYLMDCGLLCQQIGEKLSRDLNKMSKLGERIISYPSVFENRNNCVLFTMIYEQKSLDLLTNGITGLFPTKTMLLTLITLS